MEQQLEARVGILGYKNYSLITQTYLPYIKEILHYYQLL